jgi:uncharacterized protein (DUF1800 family)
LGPGPPTFREEEVIAITEPGSAIPAPKSARVCRRIGQEIARALASAIARGLFMAVLAFVLLPIASPALAGPAEQALITHYYQSILQRAPDAGGLAYWDSEATRLKNAGQDPKEAFLAMATQFFGSPEYLAFGRTDTGFATDLYQTFFQRAPDSSGLSFWQGQLAQGMPRGVVLASFLFSAEFDAFIGARLGTTAVRPEGTAVMDFYRGYLVRLPDPGGLTYWIGQFRSAQCAGNAALAASADSISLQFQRSTEYAARARSNDDFVGDLYSAFLRRGGDLAGVKFWVNQLNAGISRDVIRLSFIASPEFQGRLGSLAAAGCYAAPLPKRLDAARLLQQATFGASLYEISRAADLGADAWLGEQFAIPATSYADFATLNIALNKLGANGCSGANLSSGCPWQVNWPAFYKQAFEGPDQLRQRVANALLQIMVISIAHNRVLDAGTAMPSYLDVLGRGAFGNFRSLLKEVTLHPGMGIYLDMLGSSLEVPNENYARELLQLFSIGTVMLNDDGTVKRDAQGNAIPAYGEDVVQGFAKAFTGWHFANQDMTKSWKFYWPDEQWSLPMQPWSARRCPQDGHWPPGSATWCDLANPAKSYPPPHDTGTKKLLQYAGAPFASLPAGQTPEQDLDNAIDNIFNHPNVGPFVVKQLIQRLVTSNPTPGYVQRVAAVFNNNGSNVRGDMKAVVRAILLDTEARDPAVAAGNTFGKLREPVVKFLHLHRAFNARASSGYYSIWDLSDPDYLGQAPLKAPSVFNFYGRDFAPAGPLGQAGLVGPEFDITTTSAVAGFSDFTNWGVVGGFNQGSSDASLWIKPNYDRYLAGASALADDPQALVDELDVLLTAGNLKAKFKTDLVNVLKGVTRTVLADQRGDRLRIALWQIIHSAEYAVQR